MTAATASPVAEAVRRSHDFAAASVRTTAFAGSVYVELREGVASSDFHTVKGEPSELDDIAAAYEAEAQAMKLRASRARLAASLLRERAR